MNSYKQKKDWEIEFDEKFHITEAVFKSKTATMNNWWEEEYGFEYYENPHKEIKDFISNLINQ